MRARAADAGRTRSVKLRARASSNAPIILPQRAVEHLPGQRLEDPVAEGEIDAEIDLGAALAVGPEFPAVVQIFERALDIVDLDLVAAAASSTREVKVSLSAPKPTTRSATISVSLSERIRVAATQGRNS